MLPVNWLYIFVGLFCWRFHGTDCVFTLTWSLTAIVCLPEACLALAVGGKQCDSEGKWGLTFLVVRSVVGRTLRSVSLALLDVVELENLSSRSLSFQP